jgi:hypothetical protein
MRRAPAALPPPPLLLRSRNGIEGEAEDNLRAALSHIEGLRGEDEYGPRLRI